MLVAADRLPQGAAEVTERLPEPVLRAAEVTLDIKLRDPAQFVRQAPIRAYARHKPLRATWYASLAEDEITVWATGREGKTFSQSVSLDELRRTVVSPYREMLQLIDMIADDIKDTEKQP